MQTTIKPDTSKYAEPHGEESSAVFPEHLKVGIVLFCLLVLDLIAFGSSTRNVGFYLDDWWTLELFHFGPSDLGQRFVEFWLNDPRKIMRPLEALLASITFTLFGTKPLGYHVLICLVETTNAFLLFKIISKYCSGMFIPAATAALFLILPTHDSTHYWVGTVAQTVALSFYLLSWLCADEYARTFNLKAMAASVAAFAASLFVFECFVPLAAINVLTVVYWSRKGMPGKQSFRAAALLTALYAGCIAALLGFQRGVVPNLGHPAMLHPIHLDIANMLGTLTDGFQIALLTSTVPFFAQRVPEQFPAGLNIHQWVLLAAAVGTLVIGGIAVRYGETQPPQKSTAVRMIVLAFAIIFFSYLIFGLNADYRPTLLALFNRINLGASIGTALILASLIEVGAAAWRKRSSARGESVFRAGALSVMAAFCIVADWAQAVPWTLSHTTHRNIAYLMKTHVDQLRSGDSVILVGCPRYVLWSPVFDGVWDFQAMVRLVTNNKKINAGVVSERMVVSKTDVKDVTIGGVVCATYPFSTMYMFVPQTNELLPVRDGKTFARIVMKHGLMFGMDKKLVQSWLNEAPALSGSVGRHK